MFQRRIYRRAVAVQHTTIHDREAIKVVVAVPLRAVSLRSQHVPRMSSIAHGVVPVLCLEEIHRIAHASPHRPLPPLIVNPLRPDRLKPRVIKRRMKKHALMGKPRAQLRQDLIR